MRTAGGEHRLPGAITNGFNLLQVEPVYQSIIQGAIILTAVAIDSLSRRAS